MTCFSRHVYTVPRKWFRVCRNLIMRYHGTIKHVRYRKKTVEIDTGRVWMERATIHALPDALPYGTDGWPSMKGDDVPPLEGDLEHAVNALDEIIQSRLRFDNCEVYLEEQFRPVSVWDVLRFCRDESITNWYYSKTQEEAVLVLHGRHALHVQQDRIHDVLLGALDLDDGFATLGHGLIFPEWHGDFRRWKAEFEEDPETHWRTPIIPRNFQRT